MSETEQRSPWYRKGLRFGCTQCGHCCRIEGYVWVEKEEIDEISTYLDLDRRSFGKRYLRRVDGDLSLVEKPNHECIFWEDGCTIYPVRPSQCRTFPFWDENLESPKAWVEAAVECPGMRSKKGRRYHLTEIEELARGEGETSMAQPKKRRRRRKGS